MPRRPYTLSFVALPGDGQLAARAEALEVPPEDVLDERERLGVGGGRLQDQVIGPGPDDTAPGPAGLT